MSEISISQLMVPLGERQQVGLDDSLKDVFMALERAREKYEAGSGEGYGDLCIMAVDESGGIVGKLSMWDAISALEPERRRQLDSLSMVDDRGLSESPLRFLAAKATGIRVRDIMQPIAETAFIDESASMDQAVHQLIRGDHFALLVTRAGVPCGLLRLGDVFQVISREMGRL
jgi:hypothetical protein